MEKSTKELRIVFCNTDSLENAKIIAEKLIQNNFAACVSIIQNVLSVYEWEGKVENRPEFTLKIKTSKQNLDLLEKLILENHPDDVPEIISVKIEEGLKSYLDWLEDSVTNR